MPKYAQLRFPPGVYRNGTLYQAKGRWYAANLVRWSEGTMQPIGGWVKVQDTTDTDLDVTDPVRGLYGWRSTGQAAYLALGTYNKAYAFSAGVLTDITPAGFTAGGEGASTSEGDYGNATYGDGAYNVGSGAGTGAAITEANSWAFDNFGEHLIGCAYSEGKVHFWNLNVGTDLAVVAAGAPTGCKSVFVTPERFVVALGGTDYNQVNPADGRRVTWCDQEDYTEWNPVAAGSDAGDIILPGVGAAMCGARSRTESLIWTDVDLFAMRYIGGTLVYSFVGVGSNCGIISRRAHAEVDGRSYWMGQRGFFVYDGFVRPLECDISDDVFSALNSFEASRIAAWSVNEFNEIWWAYPAEGSSENNKIVVYNYLEDHWSGPWDLVRTDGTDRNVFSDPVLTDSEGGVYFHENGTVMLDEDDTTPLLPSAESGPFELGNGDNVLTINRYIPDENTVGDVDATLYAALYPTASETSQALTVGAITDARLTGRQVRLAIAQSNVGWRFGNPRLEVVQRGRR
jgi:hypothetical protein